MKLCLAQIEVVPNKPEQNVSHMLEVIAKAKRKSVELVVFPEMSVGGYLSGDRWQESSFCRNLMRFNDKLREASEGTAIAYGNVYMEEPASVADKARNHHPNKDGRPRKHNAVYVFQDQKPARRLRPTNHLPEGVVPKTLLPEYRIFDDERYFFSTQDVAKDFGVHLQSLLQPILIEARGRLVPVGFELCEDMWCEDARLNGNALNPTKILIQNGAKLVMNLSASPWTFGKNATRDRKVRFLKSQSGQHFVPFFYVNCVGVQNNGKDFALFDGASTVYNADGLPVVLGNSNYEEESIVVESSDLPKRPLPRTESPKTEQQFQGIVRGIRHMNDILGRVPKYVIGMSGGVDSAVVATLLTVAVGKKNVVGVNMPTRHNRKATRDSARHVAEKLGIAYLVVPIADLVEANRRALMARRGGREALAPNLEQNIQAKVRTQILSNLAERYGGLYTCNGNKWEIATGYSTLDGDARGALAPIGDLTKTEVYKMAQHLNKNVFIAEVIPSSVINLKQKPGAELSRNQANPLKLGYHCALIEAFMDFRAKSPEDVMTWYLEGTLEENLGLTTEVIEGNGVDRPEEFVRDMDWFSSHIQSSVYKRIQCPPIILLSKTAYGYDRRESILPLDETRLYRSLRAKVLSMGEYHPASRNV